MLDKFVKLLSVIVLFSYSLVAHATMTLSCTLDRVTLDSITTLSDTSTNLLVDAPYDASACLGFDGENDDPFSFPDRNIGELNDGLLNGEGGLFTGLEFIEASDLQDIDGDGNFTDPGWIHLAHFNPENNPDISYESLGPSPLSPLVLDIEDLLTFTLDCGTGLSECSWSIITKTNIILDVQQLLGPATFDHLAFSIKAGGGGNSGGGFIVYDFDFEEIFANEFLVNPGSSLNFLTPYVLSGTLDTGDLGNKDISHLNVWARDPSDPTQDISEPPMIVITMFVLSWLWIRRFKLGSYK